MHPPLIPRVELRLDPSPRPLEERRVLRRSAPEHLRFDQPAPAGPLLVIEPRWQPPVPAQRGGWIRRLAGTFRLLAPA